MLAATKGLPSLCTRTNLTFNLPVVARVILVALIGIGKVAVGLGAVF